MLGFGLAFAQTGLQGGSDGIHQQNANTLGQWNFSFGLGGDLTLDSWSLSRAGQFNDFDGEKRSFNSDDASISGNVNIGIGLLEFWDIGASLPIYYDHANSDDGKTGDMWGSGMGDLSAWTKVRAPFADDMFFDAAIILGVNFPTGTSSVGVRPRHAWYLNDDGATNAYTADDWSFVGTLALTLDFAKLGFPLRWNMSAGFVGALDKHESNTFVYSTGLNAITSNSVDLFLEFSGEMRVQKSNYPRDPMVDPMVLTPGFRFHFGDHVDMTLGLDVAVRALDNLGYDKDDELDGCENYTVQFKSGKSNASYCYSSTPIIAATAALVWRFDAIKRYKPEPDVVTKSDKIAAVKPLDSDGDGVIDSLDKCPFSQSGIKVDSTGCGIDSDGDGVLDENDKCPNTKAGVKVDDNGCVGDTDNDGVLDDRDECPNTPRGFRVDSVGCSADGDKDGVPDMIDKCPTSKPGAVVDSVGCDVDSDHDGVPDGSDKCPNTIKGATVDSVGCTMDTDNDGVPDGLDQCPDTRPGARVEGTGCEADFDKDGVPDVFDLCPNTLPGMLVDSTGCVRDDDKDGVPDQQDKCPNTPRNVTVDTTGCPLDFDKDGVADVFDKCPNTKRGAVVDSVGCEIDTDKDGVPDGIDKCPNSPKKVPVDSTGCSLDSDGDFVPDYKDECANTPKGISVDAKGCPASKKEDLEALGRGLNFDRKSAVLTKGSHITIGDIVKLMNKVPSLNIEVQGYVDGKGSEEQNKKFAENRAAVIVDALKAKGIDSKRLRYKGFNSETAGKKGKNERIELVSF